MSELNIQIIADVVALLERQRQTMESVVESLAVLSSFFVDGLRIAALPELPSPVVSLPQGDAPTIDTAELTASLAPLIEGMNTALSVSFDDLKATMGQAIDQMKRAQPQTVRSGGGGVVSIKNKSSATINPATEETLGDVLEALGGTDKQVKLDYDGRNDGNPVYVGTVDQGTPTTTAIWSIQKLTYDDSARLTDKQQITGAWDDRASLGWV